LLSDFAAGPFFGRASIAWWPFVKTLTAIDLSRQCLSLEGLDVVSDVFSGNCGVLTSARLELKNLSPQAVDMLAERFQSLADLTLMVWGITGGDAGDEYHHSEVDFFFLKEFHYNENPSVGSVLPPDGEAHLPPVAALQRDYTLPFRSHVPGIAVLASNGRSVP
jgi:hypothetical protein